MKPRFAFALTFPILAAIACGGTSGADICSKLSALCDQPATKTDGGATISLQSSCDANAVDKLSNKSEIKSCLDAAKDCNAATLCLLKAKP
jgi:hypothetical protein